MKKYVKLTVKVIVSGIALYWVISKLDFQEMLITLKSAKIWLIFFALFFYVLSQYIAADRLKFLFRKIGVNLSVIENIKLYLLGLFYNLFLPGGVGGDGYKIYFIDKYLNIKIKKTISIILTDRVSGLTIIGIFIVFFSYFINYNFPLKTYIWLLIPIAILSFWLFIKLINKSLTKIFFPVFGRAFAVQIFQMATAMMILLSLESNISGNTGNYLFLFFASSIMASIPISLGGLGMRELTFLWGAQHLGIDQTIAVSLSLMFYLISVITAFPGVFYTVNPKKILALY